MQPTKSQSAPVTNDADIAAFKMDLHRIPLIDSGNAVIVTIDPKDGFILDRRYADDFRIRAQIYGMMHLVLDFLPSNLRLVISEAYRPLKRQRLLWQRIETQMRHDFPTADEQRIRDLCENFVANPDDGIGSGHQAACALDVTLCTTDGTFLEMGTAMHEFNEKTQTIVGGLPPQIIENRHILVNAMHRAGFINYPAEWWHYSYGDHQWAWLTQKSHAIFGPIDLPEK